MGTLQTSPKRATTDGALLSATNRRYGLTRSPSNARKSRAFNGKVPSPIVGDEWNLIKQAIAGSPAAHERLFKTHSPRLYRTAFAVLHNKEDAEDAVQESWYKAFTNLDSFEGRSTFSTWLTRIAVNSALMLRRRKTVRKEGSLDEGVESESESFLDRVVAEQPNPEDLFAAVELNALIEGQLRKLTPGVEAAFRLREIEGYSSLESVQALRIHMGAFKSRISRARHRLADGLKQSILRPAPKQVMTVNCD